MISRATFEGFLNDVKKKVDGELKKHESDKEIFWVSDLRKHVSARVITSPSGLDDAFKETFDFLEAVPTLVCALVMRWQSGKIKIEFVAKFGKSDDVFLMPSSMIKNAFSRSETSTKDGKTSTLNFSSKGVSAAGAAYWLQGEPSVKEVRDALFETVDQFFERFE